jgi:hypothetical protein
MFIRFTSIRQVIYIKCYGKGQPEERTTGWAIAPLPLNYHFSQLDVFGYRQVNLAIPVPS